MALEIPTIRWLALSRLFSFRRTVITLTDMTTPSRRQWTDETIRAELLPIVEELGRFPRNTELTERGIGGLWAAMGRRGGVDAWRELAAAQPAAPVATQTATAFAPSEEQIAIAAYFLFENGYPGGPETHWLLAQRELAAA